MERGEVNPALIEALRLYGEDVNASKYEAWGNGTYDVLVRRRQDGIVHLSIKRLDRHAIRDWRHLQQIKNEILDPELMAVEIFPPESSLVDTSNELHLWHAPKMKLPFLEKRAAVMTPVESRVHTTSTPGTAASIAALNGASWSFSSEV